MSLIEKKFKILGYLMVMIFYIKKLLYIVIYKG